MSGSVNKVIDYEALYISGKSIPQVSAATGLPLSTIRCRLKKSGVLRGRTEAVRLAASQGRIGSGNRGKTRIFSEDHKRAIAESRRAWGARFGVGISLKPNGYLEYTRGPNKGRLVHVIEMENRLGRGLKPDECVHHINGDKLNNHEDNLALVTRAGHARLHRFEQRMSNSERVEICQAA